MGADGGIIGIKLRGETYTSSERMAELVAAVPWEVRTEDDSEHYPYREAEEIPGYWYSTYGSFQDWDLGDLVEMVDEAREMVKMLGPDATFEDWCTELYTNPLTENPGWLLLPDGGLTHWGTMSEFLAERYMSYSRYGYSHARVLQEPVDNAPGFYNDGLYVRNIAAWIAVIEAHVDLAAGVDREETWT